MTDPASERAVEENQREAERSALRNLRAALDEIGKQEPRDSKFGRYALVVGGLVIIVLVVASVIALTNAKRASERNDAARIALTTAQMQYLWQVEKRIRDHLTVPPGVSHKASTLIELTLSQAGAVTDFKTLNSSGIAPYDEAIRQAVFRAGPFAPVPAGSADPSRPFRLKLQLEAKGSR
jgi:TonB family protein